MNLGYLHSWMACVLVGGQRAEIWDMNELNFRNRTVREKNMYMRTITVLDVELVWDCTVGAIVQWWTHWRRWHSSRDTKEEGGHHKDIWRNRGGEQPRQGPKVGTGLGKETSRLERGWPGTKRTIREVMRAGLSSSLVMWGSSHICCLEFIESYVMRNDKFMVWKDPLAAALETEMPETGHCLSWQPLPKWREDTTPWPLQMCRLSDSEFSRFRTLTHTASAGDGCPALHFLRRSGPMLWRWDGKVWSSSLWIQIVDLALRKEQTLLLGPRCLDHGSLYTKALCA